MNLTELRTEIKLLIGTAAGSQLSSSELDRAVNLGVSAINRFYPRELVAVTVWNKEVTGESFTSSHDTAVTLNNKPIKFGSEIVTDACGSCGFEKDSDYEMDYINGTITVLSTGDMADCTSFLINYELDPFILDLGSLLTEPIAIIQIDVRSNHEAPRVLEGWQKFGDFLTIGRRGIKSQEPLIDNDEISIWYIAQHTEPTTGASGSFDRFLDELLIVGASGYALSIEGLEREHQAVTDVASSRTSIGNIGARHTEFESILGNVDTEQTAAKTAIGTANAAFDSASAQITNAITEIGLANAELDKGTPVTSAETALAAATTALADIDTILDKVATSTDAITDSAHEALDQIDTEADKIPTAADAVIAQLTTSTRNADDYLDQGDALLNAINNSPNAPQDYAAYANAKILIAQTFVQEGQLRVQFVQARAQEASGRLSMAQTFIQEASARLNHASTEVAIASGYVSVANRHIQAGLGYVRVASEYLNAAATYIQQGIGYIQEVTQRLSLTSSELDQANAVLTQINMYLAEADRYQNASSTELNIGRDMRNLGERYLQSFFNALRDRQKIASSSAMSSVRQYSSFDR